MKMIKYLVLFTLLVFITNCETFFELVGADVGPTNYTHHDYCLSDDKVKCYHDIDYDIGQSEKSCYENFNIVKKCSSDNIYFVCHSGGVEEGEFFIYYYNSIVGNENYQNPLTGNIYMENDYIDLINEVDDENNEKCARTIEDLEKIIDR